MLSNVKTSGRRILGAVIVVVAGIATFLFAGGQVAGCLGPLGVTPIQCAKVTGIVPTVGLALPLLALAVAIGLLIIVPIPANRRRSAAVAGAITAAVAALAFAATWERTWTGPDSTGRILSIDRPLDLGALAAMAVAAAAVGAIAWAFAGARIQTSLEPPSEARVEPRSYTRPDG